MKVLEEELKAQETEVIKVEAQLKSAKDSIKQEERKKSQIIKGRKTDEKSISENDHECYICQRIFSHKKS